VAKTYSAFAHDVVSSDFDGACRLMTKDARADVVGALSHLSGSVTAAANAAWSSSFWSAYAPAKRTSASAKRSPRPR
jgi:hypothetical protein